MSTHNPIICAIDTTDIDKAKRLARQIKPHIGAIKLGLEFFTYNGVRGVKELEASGIPIFLDLKFHDIPNTVVGAMRALSDLNIFMTTVHISGGKKMMEDASKTISDIFKFENAPKVVGVTVLTSLERDDLRAIGIERDMKEQVKSMAQLAKNAGLGGIVCSALELDILKAAVPKSFLRIVPGIRPEGSAKDDQKRTMTPKEALKQGADYLVIGRPITEAENPGEAAAEIYQNL